MKQTTIDDILDEPEAKTKKPKKAKKAPPKKASTDPVAEGRARAVAASNKIREVLDEHQCEIVPFITTPENVGADGRKMLLSASFGIVPKM